MLLGLHLNREAVRRNCYFDVRQPSQQRCATQRPGSLGPRRELRGGESPLPDELPGFDTGVCVVGGTAIGMLTRLEAPLFESVAVENDSSPPSP